MNGLVVMVQAGVGARQLVKRVGIIRIYCQRLLTEINGPLRLAQLQYYICLVGQCLTVIGFDGQDLIVNRQLVGQTVLQARAQPKAVHFLGTLYLFAIGVNMEALLSQLFFNTPESDFVGIDQLVDLFVSQALISRSEFHPSKTRMELTAAIR